MGILNFKTYTKRLIKIATTANNNSKLKQLPEDPSDALSPSEKKAKTRAPHFSYAAKQSPDWIMLTNHSAPAEMVTILIRKDGSEEPF